jgi:hypothetical protein
MGRKKSMTNTTNSTIIDDSILAGIVDVFPECKVIPQQGNNGRTCYRIEGDYDAVLQKIYSNKLVGSLDVLKAIKAARQAIFSFRTNQEKEKGDVRNGNIRY